MSTKKIELTEIRVESFKTKASRHIKGGLEPINGTDPVVVTEYMQVTCVPHPCHPPTEFC